MDQETLTDDLYGSSDEHPSAEIDMTFGEWNEGAQPALEMRYGPPIAWEFRDGTLHLWGEQLDSDTLRKIADACNEEEREHSKMEIYDAAENASSAATKIIRAEVKNG